MAQFKETFFALLCALIGIAQGFVFPLEDPNEFIPMKDMKNDEFDWALFKSAVKEKKGENVVISPFSVKLLLSIISEAAVAGTKQELLSVLPFVKPELIGRYYDKVLRSLSRPSSDYEMFLGTNLYVGEALKPQKNFINMIRKQYSTTPYLVNFEDNVRTAGQINAWVEHITKHHIKDLVSAEEVKDFIAVLVNAIYFKGAWEKGFNKDDTFSASFNVNPKYSVHVEMMTIPSEEFYFLNSQELDADLLRMQYKGGKYAMTIILPHQNVEIDTVIENIKPGMIQYLQSHYSKPNVTVTIPKFQFESTSHLKGPIQSVGIRKVFDENAELPYLDKNAYLSDVVQKAGVTVDEEGTVVFAASKAIVAFRLSSDVEEFYANRPFAFFIEDESTGALLFAGKVVDPTKN